MILNAAAAIKNYNEDTVYIKEMWKVLNANFDFNFALMLLLKARIHLFLL